MVQKIMECKVLRNNSKNIHDRIQRVLRKEIEAIEKVEKKSIFQVKMMTKMMTLRTNHHYKAKRKAAKTIIIYFKDKKL